MKITGSAKRRDLSVCIIGAGFGGIAAAVKLQRAGFGEFTLFEKSSGPGGTWWDNHYPGCEVDIPSHAYSFSFMRYDWPRTHALREELRDYAAAVVRQFGLQSHIRYDTKVKSATWDGAQKCYVVRTERGDEFTFDVVISALGLLSNPRYPTWPGLDEFQGPVFHTARWDSNVDLRDKRVALVGTGSTAVQIGPAIATKVDKLIIFQREPGWIQAKNERDYTERERARFRRYPLLLKLDRLKIFYAAERRFRAFDVTSSAQAKARAAALTYIEQTIKDPDVRKAVTPTYPFGCKRIVMTSTFYPMLNRDNVDLVPRPVTSVTERSVVDVDGVEHDVDVIILSTGCQPTKFLAGLDVIGIGGRNIHDVWGGQPEAFLGVTVPGFPNFFMLYGPNTNGGTSIIAQLERQAEVLVRSLRHMRRRGKRVVDTRPQALIRYNRWIDKQLTTHASAMESGCHNYYHSATGRNVTQWPRTHSVYYAVTKLLPPFGLLYRR
jgi:cation diffusion facilitator CzcD-associated flavoprotein CzcO